MLIFLVTHGVHDMKKWLNKFKKQTSDTKTDSAELSAKEIATRKKEPWVQVINTHVNQENIRNGFFELDWNEYFILELKQAGYGYEGDPEEEIVDRWFRDIVSEMLSEDGLDPNRGSGFINVNPISQGRSEIS